MFISLLSLPEHLKAFKLAAEESYTGCHEGYPGGCGQR